MGHFFGLQLAGKAAWAMLNTWQPLNRPKIALKQRLGAKTRRLWMVTTQTYTMLTGFCEGDTFLMGLPFLAHWIISAATPRLAGNVKPYFHRSTVLGATPKARLIAIISLYWKSRHIEKNSSQRGRSGSFSKSISAIRYGRPPLLMVTGIGLL